MVRDVAGEAVEPAAVRPTHGTWRLRARLAVASLAMAPGCGRVSFGYPVVPCDEVTGAASTLAGNDHCYTRHDVPTSYNAAVSTCEDLGGHIATLSSAEENEAIVTLGLSEPVRVGLDNGSSGSTTWAWNTGESVAYSNWAAGEPVVQATCMSTVLVAGDGSWRTDCAGLGFRFACEIEPWLVRDDGHAYRKHWAKLGWYEAEAACDALGAHLVTITDSAERAFLAALIDEDVWLGANGVGGVFAWVTGEPFGYANWGSTEPDLPGEACLRINESGVWADLECSAMLRAVCERE